MNLLRAETKKFEKLNFAQLFAEWFIYVICAELYLSEYWFGRYQWRKNLENIGDFAPEKELGNVFSHLLYWILIWSALQTSLPKAASGTSFDHQGPFRPLTAWIQLRLIGHEISFIFHLAQVRPSEMMSFVGFYRLFVILFWESVTSPHFVNIMANHICKEITFFPRTPLFCHETRVNLPTSSEKTLISFLYTGPTAYSSNKVFRKINSEVLHFRKRKDWLTRNILFTPTPETASREQKTLHMAKTVTFCISVLLYGSCLDKIIV